jgi:hypothetical protein
MARVARLGISNKSLEDMKKQYENATNLIVEEK